MIMLIRRIDSMALLKPRMAEEALLAPRDLRVRAPTIFDPRQGAHLDRPKTLVFKRRSCILSLCCAISSKENIGLRISVREKYPPTKLSHLNVGATMQMKSYSSNHGKLVQAQEVFGQGNYL